MRIDIVSIFPAYLDALGLSLPGRARAGGLVDLRVHDLRRWTSDRHRTVDDTPYGGGAGMVMAPEPWGRALDELVPLPVDPPTLLVPTPAGRPFRQADAERLSALPWLVIACGRYEGIDQRVLDEASTRMPVEEVSLGDYVLNGGEVAALAVVEAVVRLLPGVLGNPASLSEESHAVGADGALLEYPVYTKPASWRGRDVPEVLLTGDHARIARWRREQSLRRTAERRPDLVHPSRTLSVEGLSEAVVRLAEPADSGELWTLQRACWLQEAQANDTLAIPALTETFADVRESLTVWDVYVVRSHGRLVGSVRVRLRNGQWEIGRIMVAPDLQGRGLGRWLLELAESRAPAGATAFALFTGAASRGNLRMYRRAGYRTLPQTEAGVVRLVKARA
jgi:tRNA (guanine37-N1)-methyltransferase